MSAYININIEHPIFYDSIVEISADGHITKYQPLTRTSPEYKSTVEDLKIEVLLIDGKKYNKRVMQGIAGYLLKNHEQEIEDKVLEDYYNERQIKN